MENHNPKSLGQAIDEIIVALKDLDENSRLIAIKAVVEHLNIAFSPGIISSKNDTSITQINTTDVLSETDTSKSQVVDIQTLKENKNPSNDIEMACVVAFYLEHHAPENERKDYITNKDIEKYFKQAKFPLPKAPSQVPLNAKTAGYFDSSERGKYKLNPVGYNLVAYKMPKQKKN
jgi:hypothetical protein